MLLYSKSHVQPIGQKKKPRAQSLKSNFPFKCNRNNIFWIYFIFMYIYNNIVPAFTAAAAVATTTTIRLW